MMIMPSGAPQEATMQQGLAVVALGVGLLLTGCVAESGWKVAYEQERAARQDQDTRIRTLEAQQRQLSTAPTQPAPTPRKVGLAEIHQRCQQVQQDKTSPIGCTTGVTQEGNPYISFAFVDINGMRQYWDGITKFFLDDFCGRHNEAGAKAFVLAMIVKPEPGAWRGASCFNSYVSDWRPIKEPSSSSKNRF